MIFLITEPATSGCIASIVGLPLTVTPTGDGGIIIHQRELIIFMWEETKRTASAMVIVQEEGMSAVQTVRIWL